MYDECTYGEMHYACEAPGAVLFFPPLSLQTPSLTRVKGQGSWLPAEGPTRQPCGGETTLHYICSGSPVETNGSRGQKVLFKNSLRHSRAICLVLVLIQ